jgi:hypothetical protein
MLLSRAAGEEVQFECNVQALAVNPSRRFMRRLAEGDNDSADDQQDGTDVNRRVSLLRHVLDGIMEILAECNIRKLWRASDVKATMIDNRKIQTVTLIKTRSPAANYLARKRPII